jgi:hypothetical protein
MSIGSFLDHLFHPSAQGAGASQIQAPPPSGSKDDPDFSFDDLVDIVNPLQHLPVVGTLYRAITHDTIRTPEKIAGDTLYGGLWGFVSSVADTGVAGDHRKEFRRHVACAVHRRQRRESDRGCQRHEPDRSARARAY